LGVFFYNIFIAVFRIAISIASVFNPKAKKWVEGRRNILSRLKNAIGTNDKVIWMHCASLGEFEQGRPVLEQLREQYPGYRLLLTFFSPSGYEVRKNYEGVDWVFYLPMDSARNAREFLEIVKPVLVIFVKYEFWYYYLKKIKYRNIPLLLISALFRKDMSFFKWYGGMQRKMLSRFDQLFVQNLSSKRLVNELGLGGITTVAGDTRFDRVITIADRAAPVEKIISFIGDGRAIIAGSTWPADELLLKQMMDRIGSADLKLVIAPHEIGEKQLAQTLALFPNAGLFSADTNNDHGARVMIIDNIGMLSRIYRHAWITYVGGGMRPAGIHNVLEAAVYGKVVLFGPYYKKYSEATGLVKTGGAVALPDANDDGTQLASIINNLSANTQEFESRSQAAGEFVRSNKGATEKILKFIQEKRLLTS
jgi:3-deoxy-D-manno-octulosonic-acid transferase